MTLLNRGSHKSYKSYPHADRLLVLQLSSQKGKSAVQLYFSGLNRVADVALLMDAGIEHALVDPFDLRYVAAWTGPLALDSGAFRIYRGQGAPIPLEEYAALADSRPFAFVTEPDVIGDENQTRENWYAARAVITENPLLPVWPWGGTADWLAECLDSAPVVGIGGLVVHLRGKIGNLRKTKEQLAARELMTDELLALSQAHPGRFHLFGLNWLRAFTMLWPTAASCDTSKYLDARRYGNLIFIHSRTGRLARAPARGLAQAKHLAGRDPQHTGTRLTLSAQALYHYGVRSPMNQAFNPMPTA